MSDVQSCLRERGLTQIPSELIEPYLKAMLSVELECLAYTPTEEQLVESKQNLKGVERFVQRFCGIHARYATMNIYENFYKMTLEQANQINAEVYKEIED